MNRTDRNSESGLTLIEVIFAIILFAGAMITILGLQSSNLARTNEDRNRINAMLAAREILSAIEIQEEPIIVGSYQGSVEKILSTLINHPEKIDNSPFQNLIVDLQVTNIGLPMLGEEAMQKADITVSWGDQPFEQFRTAYFLVGEINLQNQSKQPN